ncbi:type II secretion system protein [Pseudoduganella sp. FT26W]|uniref:Type II secretion system protein n=1 Tax=Duganella aquatilis TaxID=2666082 RepID=A0A844D8F8_9BURK|nr:type II secretion system protein [Duganella aquatilis]MRW83850.1 type II secretion system protein [Duganella aquatilis]
MCKVLRNKIALQRGLTIVELVIFIVIVGIAAAVLMQVMNLANKSSTDPARRKQALLIAEAYMEEVQQAQFTACDPSDANAATITDPNQCAVRERFGPEPGNVRPFDNINDYVPQNYVPGNAVRAFAVTDSSGNLVDADVSGNPLGAGTVGGNLSGITTTLALNPVISLGGVSSTLNNMTVMQITITTTYGPGQSVTLDGYRTRYAPEVR